jgi:phosphoribosylamine---glycine ligase
MNILLLGSGGREHVLAWKISQSPLLKKLFIAPGNAGTRLHGTNVNLDPENFEEVGNLVLTNAIEMVVVGPEAPLVKGIYDYFRDSDNLRHIAVIGPSAAGAILEGSKDFAKAFMQRQNIPTAAYQTFTVESLDAGLQFLETLSPPYVLKADGLAAGKGVVISTTLDEARKTLILMLQNEEFGEASRKVVIEEFLTGIEVSVFVLTDGKNYLILPEAKDYKRIGEGDTGPNTGGMGSVSPVPFAGKNFMAKVKEQIIQPTIQGLIQENIDYKGFIFFGLINVDGNPKVIEYNCRMGDPESEAVIPRIKNDLPELFLAISDQRLNDFKIEIDPRAAATVFLVSGGYPGSYQKGKVITGLEMVDGSLLFHAGTKVSGDDIVTSGGRVIAVTSLDADIAGALEKSYRNADLINFEGKNFRRDLGKDLL